MDPELLALQEEFSKISQETADSSVKIIKKSKQINDEMERKIEIPSAISSTDNLFGDIVSDIVERHIYSDSDEEDENEIPSFNLNSSGFPEITKISFPETAEKDENLYLEQGKLEWIFDQNDNIAHDRGKKDQIRFGFKGEILLHDNFDTALYHHGNEYNRAGYSIGELNVLSKSTFASQRVMSFKILANIISIMQRNEYSDEEYHEIQQSLQFENILMSARIGLDSNHDTVVDSALNLISIYFGFKSDLLKILDQAILIENGFRTISLEQKWYQTFLLKDQQISERNYDINNERNSLDINSIQKILNSDSILGFALTDIIIRFRYLLTTKPSSIEQKAKIIHILICIALHSSPLSEDILACEGLVDFFKKTMTECISTYFEDEAVGILFANIIRLFRVLSLSSKEACAAILHHGIVDLSMTALSLNSKDSPLCTQAILLLNVNFCYSIGGFMFDKYHSLIFSCFLSLSRDNIFELTDHAQPSSDICLFIASITKLLSDVVKQYGTNIDVGGRNDMLYPFIDVLMQIMKIETMLDMNDVLYMKGSILKFFVYFLKKAMEQHEISNDVHVIIKWLSTEVTALMQTVFLLFNYRKTDINFLPKMNIYCFSDLIHAASSNMLCSWLVCSKIGDIAGSLFEALLLCAKRNWIATSILLSARCNPSINQFIIKYSQLISMKDYIHGFQRNFLVGLNHFLCSFFVFDQYILKKCLDSSFDNSSNKRFSSKLATIICSSLIPGDDYIFADILEASIGSTFIELQLFSMDSVDESRKLFGISRSDSPKSFLIDSQLKWTHLPISSFDWIYNYPKDLYQSKMAGDEYNLEKWILMVESVEFNQVTSISDSQKLKYILYIYLLHTNDEESLFRADKIYPKLDKFLRNISWTEDLCLELDDDNFFQLYQELVEAFLSESYGDPNFARVLLLPLSTYMSVRYRLHFWSLLAQHLKYLRYFLFLPNELFSEEGQFFEMFLHSKEKDKQLLQIYGEIMKKNTVPENSAIYLILTNI